MEETANVVRNGTITGMETTHFIFTCGLTATLTKQKKFSSFLSKIKITHNFALFFSDFFCPHFFLISQAKAQPEPYWPDGGPLWAASADAQWFVPRFASISYSKHMPNSPGGFL